MDITKIIPPSDYEHRNGFNNIPLINKLTDNEKKYLEDALISKLLFESERDVDILIIETLVYLKSQKLLPILKDMLTKYKHDVTKLKIASSIFEINQEKEMIEIALSTFRKLENNRDSYYVYNLSSTFYYLAKFKNSEINTVIEKYITNKEYLLTYNAKRALGIE